jgi:hypothetical protein
LISPAHPTWDAGVEIGETKEALGGNDMKELNLLACLLVFVLWVPAVRGDVRAQRTTTSPCLAGGRLVIMLRVTATGSDRLRSLSLVERLPIGWRFVPGTATGDPKPNVVTGTDGRELLAWSAFSAGCAVGEAGECDRADFAVSVEVRAGGPGPVQFDGDLEYRRVDGVDGQIVVSSEAPTVSLCQEVARASRRFLSSCRPGALLSVKLDVTPTGLQPINRLNVTEYFPVGWMVDETMLPEPAAEWDDVKGFVKWETADPGVLSFTYHLRTPSNPPGAADFGVSPLGPTASLTAGTGTAAGPVVVEVGGASRIDCSPAPTPTFPPGIECYGPGALGGSCDPTFHTCVGFRCVCVGDCNLDGSVDLGELSVLRGLLGRAPGALGSCPAADFDGDGRLRTTEMTKAVRNLSRSCPVPRR